MPAPGKNNRLRWTKQIIDSMGAEVMLDAMKFHYASPLQTRVGRNIVNGLYEDGEYRPTWAITDQPALTVVWDQHYPDRHPAYSTMRAVLASGGLTRDRVSHVWAVPHELRRPALVQEIADHRMKVRAAIIASNSPNVLLIGARAIGLWRPDLPVMAVTGGVYRWRIQGMDAFVFPIMHPGAIINDRENIGEWRRSVTTLSRAIHHGSTAWDTACIVCKEDVAIYDENAVPYCAGHFNPNNTTTKDKQWKKLTKHQNQGKLI